MGCSWGELGEYTLAPKQLNSSAEEVGLISVMQLKRHLRKGATCYIAMLTEVKEGEVDSKAETQDGASATDQPALQDTLPELRGAVEQLMRRFSKTFGPLPKQLPPRRDVDQA
jgi:hypothetical protein